MNDSWWKWNRTLVTFTPYDLVTCLNKRDFSRGEMYLWLKPCACTVGLDLLWYDVDVLLDHQWSPWNDDTLKLKSSRPKNALKKWLEMRRGGKNWKSILFQSILTQVSKHRTCFFFLVGIPIFQCFVWPRRFLRRFRHKGAHRLRGEWPVSLPQEVIVPPQHAKMDISSIMYHSHHVSWKPVFRLLHGYIKPNQTHTHTHMSRISGIILK